MLISLVDVAHNYEEIEIFREVSLSVHRGEVVGLMGPSGSGKSTVLGIIAGALKPSKGNVLRSVEPPFPWIFQTAPALTRRSALDNVALGPLSEGYSRKRSLALARKAMITLSIWELHGLQVGKLSGGERQRVAVARALASGSALLLADEPTASLDSRSKELVVDSLLRTADSGAGVVLSTHDKSVAERCHRTYEFKGGRLNESTSV